jgi:DNA-binding response OmpR family regulator
MILSGYGNSEKVIYGLNIGADDYLVKPLIPDELVARIKALMRRPIHFTPDKPLVHRGISFDTETKTVTA